MGRELGRARVPRSERRRAGAQYRMQARACVHGSEGARGMWRRIQGRAGCVGMREGTVFGEQRRAADRQKRLLRQLHPNGLVRSVPCWQIAATLRRAMPQGHLHLADLTSRLLWMLSVLEGMLLPRPRDRVSLPKSPESMPACHSYHLMLRQASLEMLVASGVRNCQRREFYVSALQSRGIDQGERKMKLR